MKKIVELISISFPGRDLNLGPVYLKNYALKNKHVANNYTINISQFDKDTSASELLDCLLSRNARIYGFSTYVWNYDLVIDVSRMLKKERPEATIILGGPEAAGLAEKLLLQHPFLDYIFVGESEISFSAFLESTELQEIPGLAYRKNDSVMINPECFVEDLNSLVLPYECEEYRTYIDNAPAPVRSAIETSRGCPFRCRYCTWGGTKMRYFSLEKLKPAFEYLFNHPNVKTVYITDSNPFLRRRRTIELLEMLIQLNVHRKSITFELAPEYMTDESILALIPKLCDDEFALGVQSTSPTVLALMDRRFNSERYLKNIDLMKSKNPDIRLWFSLIIGLPGDSYSQFLNSLDFVINMQPEGVYVHELLCLPGSEFYKNPEKYGIEYMDVPPHKVLKNKTFPEEQYNKAKLLSYFVYLLHRVESLRKNFYNMGNGKDSSLRLIDHYERFVSFLDGKLDALAGKEISEVSSWIFEQMANDFLAKEENITKLESLYDSFLNEGV